MCVCVCWCDCVFARVCFFCESLRVCVVVIVFLFVFACYVLGVVVRAEFCVCVCCVLCFARVFVCVSVWASAWQLRALVWFELGLKTQWLTTGLHVFNVQGLPLACIYLDSMQWTSTGIVQVVNQRRTTG